MLMRESLAACWSLMRDIEIVLLVHAISIIDVIAINDIFFIFTVVYAKIQRSED